MNYLEQDLLREISYNMKEHELVKELLRLCYKNILERLYDVSNEEEYTKAKLKLQKAIKKIECYNKIGVR